MVFTRSLSAAEIDALYQAATTSSPVTLQINQSGGNIVLSWPQGFLLEAPALTGPWTTNTAAVSPFTNSPAGTQRFYRVQVR